MNDVVNLRQARKRKALAEKQRLAEQNRAAFGRPKPERELDRRIGAMAERFIEGHRRVDNAPDGE